MIRNDCFCELDPTTVDRFSIPVARALEVLITNTIKRSIAGDLSLLIVAMGGTPNGPMPTKEQNSVSRGRLDHSRVGGARWK
jgi:hypothetical protein